MYESMEDVVRQENGIRRTIKKIYNKGRHNFATDEEYDDYLEEVEDKIATLMSKDVSKKE